MGMMKDFMTDYEDLEADNGHLRNENDALRREVSALQNKIKGVEFRCGVLPMRYADAQDTIKKENRNMEEITQWEYEVVRGYGLKEKEPKLSSLG